MSRPDWDTYYLGVAHAVAGRGECRRRRIGCVIVQGGAIIATGYNGTPPGDERSCLRGDCPRADNPGTVPSSGSYDGCLTTHAEANALLRAPWERLDGAVVYVTGEPCPGCRKLLASARVGRIVVG